MLIVGQILLAYGLLSGGLLVLLAALLRFKKIRKA